VRDGKSNFSRGADRDSTVLVLSGPVQHCTALVFSAYGMGMQAIWAMTVPFERTRALVQAKEFLEAMLDPKQTPRVPKALRGHAKALLRHYPELYEIELAHQARPDWYGPVPPFSRRHGRTAITELGIDEIGKKQTAEQTFLPRGKTSIFSFLVSTAHCPTPSRGTCNAYSALQSSSPCNKPCNKPCN